MKRHGFTLIELLVVLAIVGLLAALLFPTFLKAQTRARLTMCASNLHQIALALKMYENDWDTKPPLYPLRGSVETLQSVWTATLPYTKAPQIFHCPEEWGGATKILGYSYNLIGIYRLGDRFAKPRVSEAGSVVAYCTEHTKHTATLYEADSRGVFIGNYLVSREDGSAQTIAGTKIERWTLRDGYWRIRPPGSGRAGDFLALRFPDEPWPPTFEK